MTQTQTTYTTAIEHEIVYEASVANQAINFEAPGSEYDWAANILCLWPFGFGISGYREKPEDEPASYSADLSFRGIDDSENLQILLKKMNDLDQHLIDAAHTNSVAWFG
jgi:superfamily I DNA and/or RNA helicase